MSARYFCDVCTTELSDDDHGRVKKKYGNLEIEIMHALGSGWNSGNVCHSCIIQTVNHGTAVTRPERT